MTSKITYDVSTPNPHTHYFDVVLSLEGLSEMTTDLQMAVWTPGSYMVREYAKNVEQIKVYGEDGSELPAEKLNKNNWRVNNAGKNFKFQYKVYAFEETVRTGFLDESHASIIPAALFIFPVGIDVPVLIQFHPFFIWKNISTSLEMVDNDQWKRIAPNSDILIDSPIEIGNHSIHKFIAAGVEHELAIYGEGNYNTEKIESDIIKIINAEVSVFRHHPCTDDKYSNNRYVFILQNSNTGRGGLEHLNSTSLIYKRLGYTPESSYREFISLVSHEYFHLWNVKRLRPAALGPFDYTSENYTTSLWIAEGFTNYYDDIILRRANIITEQNYLEIAEKNINDVENAPGKTIHPVAQASFDAWIKYYRQNENSNNAQVNYYTKGGILAMLLDMQIIAHSDGTHSLDEVMREAYETFYLKEDRGYTETEFKLILEKYTGVDLTSFYADHVFGTVAIDYQKYFEPLGITLENIIKDTVETDLGISINDKNIITQIRKNSSGERGKLNVNDEIIAINNFRYTPTLLSTITENIFPGAFLICIVNRGGIIQSFEIQLQKTDKVNYKIIIDASISERQKKIYVKWLHLS